MISIPGQNKRWTQSNNSDLFGNVAVTKNICFDESGYLKLSPSPRSAISVDVNADFDNCAAIIKSEDHGYLAVTWDSLFDVEKLILSAYPEKNSDTGVPSGDLQSDGVWFNQLLAVSQDTDLDYYDPSSNQWTDTNISLTSGNDYQHPVVNFLSFNALAVADTNTVKLYASPLSSTPTLITTLTLPSDFAITSMVYFNQNLYVATVNLFGGKAALYVWNGNGTAAQYAYQVDSNIIFDIEVYQDSVVLFIGNGSLVRFNGTGFTMLAALPVFYRNRYLTDENNIGMRNGILKSNGDVLYLSFADSENDKSTILSQPEGIWCYDPEVGLYHRYSFSIGTMIPDTIATTDVNTTDDIITVTAAPVTGTEVFYRDDGSTTLGGLTDNAKYFVIKVDATHIKLATTKENALNGTAIDLTGTGNNAQSLIFFPNVDYGQVITADRTHAMLPIDIPPSDGNELYGTDLIWSAELASRTDPSAGKEYLGTTSPELEARGYFITPKVFSDEVTDTYNQFSIKYSPLKSDIDKIIVKYRVSDDGLDEIDISNSDYWKITWTSTTTFTTTDTHWANASIGDEVEVLRGAAGGLLAHITDVSLNTGTYTITIDETFEQYTSGDISTAVFRNWKKVMVITNTDSDGFKTQQIGDTGKFIQFKIELRGIGVKIEQLIIDNVNHLPAQS